MNNSNNIINNKYGKYIYPAETGNRYDGSWSNGERSGRRRWIIEPHCSADGGRNLQNSAQQNNFPPGHGTEGGRRRRRSAEVELARWNRSSKNFLRWEGGRVGPDGAPLMARPGNRTPTRVGGFSSGGYHGSGPDHLREPFRVRSPTPGRFFILSYPFFLFFFLSLSLLKMSRDRTIPRWYYSAALPFTPVHIFRRARGEY